MALWIFVCFIICKEIESVNQYDDREIKLLHVSDDSHGQQRWHYIQLLYKVQLGQ